MPNPFHAGYKLAWLEQVANDPEASDFHVRVAISVSRRADRTGVATAGQEGLANFIGATSRGVRNALRDLAALNHIQRQDSGAGGRGVVGRYSLILKMSGNEDGDSGKSRSDVTRNVEDCGDYSRKSGVGKPEQATSKPGTSIPALPYSSLKSLDMSCSIVCSDSLSDWDCIQQKAVARYGPEVFSSWFAKLEPGGVDDNVGIIVAKSRFVADQVCTRFGDEILRWWKQQRPSVVRIRFVVRSA
jgi:hypothetical protein